MVIMVPPSADMTAKIFGFLLVLLAVDRNHSYKATYSPPYDFYNRNNYSYSYSYGYVVPNQQVPFTPPVQPYQGPENYNPYDPESGKLQVENLGYYRQDKRDHSFGNPQDDPSESAAVGPLHENDDAQADSLPAGSHFQQSRHISPAELPERRAFDDAIVYPQNHHINSRNSVNLTGSACSHGLCEVADDYPAEHLRNLLNNTRAFDAFFNTNSPDLHSKNFGAENVCDSIVNTTFPQLALNTEQQQRFIANLDQFKQGIRIETCNGSGNKCKFSEYWPLNYQSVCEQQYTITPLLALDDKNNPVVDTFKTPSNCVCMYKVA